MFIVLVLRERVVLCTNRSRQCVRNCHRSDWRRSCGCQGNHHQCRDGHTELHRHDWRRETTPFPQVPAGDYSVTVVAPGFTTLVRNGITVSVGQTAHVDLKLGVGQGTTTVTVTEDAPLLQTDSAQNNIEVSTKDMNELPFNVAGIGSVRDPMSFAALVPGTIVGGWNDIHISGSPATTYRVFMDGLDDTSAVKGAISDENQPSVESLASQSLLVNNYSAEFGQSAGGIFNYTSKSGTNRLHGTAFNYLENEDLDAGQPFNYTGTSGQKITPSAAAA